MIHPDYIPEKVLSNAKQRLSDRYSFAECGFGQGVARSEVISLLQNTEGVVAVDLINFYRLDKQDSGLADFLIADVPKPGGKQLSPAELLTVDLGANDIRQML